MGCPSQIELGDTLVFSITTHDPDTGVLTDASAVPDYWIYEGETGVSINANTPDADVMAKLDDAHTTGFYTESIVCSTVNGYEVGKTYTVYIEATVDSDKGGIAFAFNVTNNRTLATAILAMLDDARTEPGDTALPVNPDAMTKVDYLYKFIRNKIETTENRIHVYDDAGTNKDHSSIISDDNTTFTRGEFGAGD